MQTFLSIVAIALFSVVVLSMFGIIFWPPKKKQVNNLNRYDDDYVSLALKIRECETDKDCAKALSSLIYFHRNYRHVKSVDNDVAALAEILEEKEINGLKLS